MFCSKCGNELREDDAFCSKCGTKVGTNSQSTIHLVCQHCGSVMDYDDERQIVACPYCGSKELIEESDDVKIERIKSKTVLAREKQANDFELEKDRLSEERKQKNETNNMKAACIFCTVGLILFFIVIMLIK